MQRRAISYGDSWQQGAFSNSALDYAQYVSATSHPALVAARSVLATQAVGGSALLSATAPAGPLLPQASISNTQGGGSTLWSALGPFALTTQSGDQISFATTALQVTVQLAGVLTAGMGAQAGQGFAASGIRNGCKASILVDGVVQQTLDTYGGTPQLILYLDGLVHTVAIVHTGGYSGAISPIGPVAAGTGTTVAAMLAPTAVYHPTFVAASWRVAATSATQYTLYTTPQGGTESTVATGLVTGTHYTGGAYVPGVDLVVTSTTPLTSGHTATFTTDVVMLALASVSFGTGLGSGAATWTSPVFDFGDPAMQMVVAEVQQSTALTAVVARSGQTPAVDGTWTTLSVPQSGTQTSDGTQWGTAGLMGGGGGLPAGRYGQITLQLAGISLTAPWVRDLVLYAWNPARDSIGGRLVLHAHQVLGPHLAAYLAALATWYADVRQDLLLLRAAGSIGGAVDSYLRAYMDDLGLGWVTGEPTEAARARARGVLSNAGGALSIVGIAQGVDLLVTGVAAPVTVTGAAGSWVASCGGAMVEQQAAMAYRVTVGAAPYTGLPGLAVGPSSTAGTANAIITAYVTETLRPVGAHASVRFTTSS